MAASPGKPTAAPGTGPLQALAQEWAHVGPGQSQLPPDVIKSLAPVSKKCPKFVSKLFDHSKYSSSVLCPPSTGPLSIEQLWTSELKPLSLPGASSGSSIPCFWGPWTHKGQFHHRSRQRNSLSSLLSSAAQNPYVPFLQTRPELNSTKVSYPQEG